MPATRLPVALAVSLALAALACSSPRAHAAGSQLRGDLGSVRTVGGVEDDPRGVLSHDRVPYHLDKVDTSDDTFEGSEGTSSASLPSSRRLDDDGGQGREEDDETASASTPAWEGHNDNGERVFNKNYCQRPQWLEKVRGDLTNVLTTLNHELAYVDQDHADQRVHIWETNPADQRGGPTVVDGICRAAGEVWDGRAQPVDVYNANLAPFHVLGLGAGYGVLEITLAKQIQQLQPVKMTFLDPSYSPHLFGTDNHVNPDELRQAMQGGPAGALTTFDILADSSLSLPWQTEETSPVDMFVEVQPGAWTWGLTPLEETRFEEFPNAFCLQTNGNDFGREDVWQLWCQNVIFVLVDRIVIRSRNEEHRDHIAHVVREVTNLPHHVAGDYRVVPEIVTRLRHDGSVFFTFIKSFGIKDAARYNLVTALGRPDGSTKSMVMCGRSCHPEYYINVITTAQQSAALLAEMTHVGDRTTALFHLRHVTIVPYPAAAPAPVHAPVPVPVPVMEEAVPASDADSDADSDVDSEGSDQATL